MFDETSFISALLISQKTDNSDSTPTNPTRSSGRIINRGLTSTPCNPSAQSRSINFKAYSSRRWHWHNSTQQMYPSAWSTSHKAAWLRRRGTLFEPGHPYEDEVLSQLFKDQRDERIERQIEMVQSALEDIRKEIQSLREAITLGKKWHIVDNAMLCVMNLFPNQAGTYTMYGQT